jgi:formamidopyrimidine-DNA glycosylase
MDLWPAGGSTTIRRSTGWDEEISNQFSAAYLEGRLTAEDASEGGAARPAWWRGSAASMCRKRCSGRGVRSLAGAIRRDRLEAGSCGSRVIDEAIEAGGSTISDFGTPDGELGYFQHPSGLNPRRQAADLREPVKRMVQSGRSTFCASCQR